MNKILKKKCGPSQLRIALVVPSYNEERRLNKKAFIDALNNYHNLTLFFVDDGSKDNTLSVIKDICAVIPERSMYLSLDKNKGKAEAVRAGMLALLQQTKYDLIGFWDADLAVPLSEVMTFSQIYSAQENVLAVIGSRAHLAGRVIERVHFRHYLGRLFATLVCLTFNLTIYDTQCGAKIFNADLLSLVTQEPFCSNWIFDVEIFLRISRLSYIAQSNNWLFEVSVSEWRNVSGTKRKFSSYIKALYDYFSLVRKYLFLK